MVSKYCTEDFCKTVLKQLVGINTSQPEGNERLLADQILSYFPDNLPFYRIEHSDTRHSLVIVIPGEADAGGLAFIGHMDTVAFGDETAWRHPPLSAAEEDGCLWGRGMADMKGGLAAMIAAAMSILASGRTPREPIYFCFTADEENLGLGAMQLADREILSLVRELWITEPSAGAIGVCEKGALWLRIIARGKLSHGSRPEIGTNSIEGLIRLYHLLRERIDRKTENPYLGTATLSLTKLCGGIATNVIPDYAEMELDIRTIPGLAHRDLLETLSACMKEAEAAAQDLHLEAVILNDRAAVGIPYNDPMVGRIEAVCAAKKWQPEKRGLYFYTDASQLVPALQKPFVIMGPGEDAMAHQTNERIRIADVVQMAQLYTDYTARYYLDSPND